MNTPHENHPVTVQHSGTLLPKPLRYEKKAVDELLVITTFPPRECGIATYSQDLIYAIQKSFNRSLKPVVCALENNSEKNTYAEQVKYTLNTEDETSYQELINQIHFSTAIKAVLIQHEFGLFEKPGETAHLPKFLQRISKPVVIVFHTVLPEPNEQVKQYVENLVKVSNAIIVMTKNAASVLQTHYTIESTKVSVIAHGTHLVKHEDKKALKKKYDLSGRKVLTTFGLLSAGKSIETTLQALPLIVKKYPKTIFLILGKTHPAIVKHEGEKYRESLHAFVKDHGLENNVRFVNQYLSLQDLLEYLQLTDIYLFTSKDPHQAVSGTFAYAMSCACAIISTPIPHAKELINEHGGMLIDFQNHEQLATSVLTLLENDTLRQNMSINALHAIAETSWENSAIAHANLFKELLGKNFNLKHDFPELNFGHLNRMTDAFGLVQFSKINNPDLSSGYTLDDNARALITVLTHYALTGNRTEIKNIKKYINIILHCQQRNGRFLNYVNSDRQFTSQNFTENLDDANGRAIWATGFTISMEKLLPQSIIKTLEKTFLLALENFKDVESPRAIAFAIKGIYYFLQVRKNDVAQQLIHDFAERLTLKFADESSGNWQWFERYLTYANSLLPEALLMASKITGNNKQQMTALHAFNFLLSQTFTNDQIQVVSNKSWQHKDRIKERYGEQPIEIAYTILALGTFYDTFKTNAYKEKMQIAFSWFVGNNHLKQTIYNATTGGCFDGLEQHHVNLNQGAESTVCYLLARLTVAKYLANDLQNSNAKLIEQLMEEDLRTAS
jgi:glycosyltransferase involved in cell wall biosynthesis